MRELLCFLSIKYKGDYNKIKKAIENNETIEKEIMKRYLNKLKCHYVTILDDDYPQNLRHLKDPPFVLFYYGDLSLTKQEGIAMIGMRDCSKYGREAAKYLSQSLSEDYVIISGLAKGIDGVSHRYAKKTIAVLGCGIDYCYPKSHQDLYDHIKKHGLIMSEYPFDTPPKPYYFPWRNRIVAGLSSGIVVVEAKKKSGTMITVGYGLELGKPIFCVPCRIFDHLGTIELIKDGAFCIESDKDIRELLNLYKKD